MKRLEKIMRHYVLALLMMTWACPTAAETWKWTDAQGTLNFTDNYMNIPKQYRKSAVKIGDVDAKPAPPLTAPVARPSDAAQGTGGGPAGSDRTKAATPAGETLKSPDSHYGGKSAAEWREAFSALSTEIRGVDGQLKEKQRLLKEPGTLSRSDYLKLEDEIRRLSSSLTALLARWELLNKEATAAQVPLELRQ